MTLQNFTLGTFAQGAAGGGGAFESIASASGTGSANTITFSSIPSNYQHIQIRCIARSVSAGTGGDCFFIRLNGVTTTSSYTSHSVQGNGTTVSARGVATGSISYSELLGTNGSNFPTAGDTANVVGIAIVDIHDYATTTKNKTIRAFGAHQLSSGGVVSLASGLFVSTNAITSVTIGSISGGNFTTTSQFALYGIKGA